MIVSFKERELRDEAINEIIAVSKYTKNTCEKFKFVLTLLNAADNISSLPDFITSKLSFTNGVIILTINQNLKFHFRIAHYKKLLDKTQPLVSKEICRLQLTWIEETNAL